MKNMRNEFIIDLIKKIEERISYLEYEIRMLREEVEQAQRLLKLLEDD